jgi:hypothetical protein
MNNNSSRIENIIFGSSDREQQYKYIQSNYYMALSEEVRRIFFFPSLDLFNNVCNRCSYS